MTQVNQNWQEHAYPLKQITIKLQGTRHSDIADIISQLEQVADKINAGIAIGYMTTMMILVTVSMWSTQRTIHFLKIRQVTDSDIFGSIIWPSIYTRSPDPMRFA